MFRRPDTETDSLSQKSRNLCYVFIDFDDSRVGVAEVYMAFDVQWSYLLQSMFLMVLQHLSTIHVVWPYPTGFFPPSHLVYHECMCISYGQL